MLDVRQYDDLGLTSRQLEIVAGAVPLRALPVDDRIAERTYEAADHGEAGAIRTRSFTSHKLSRLTAYRFHRTGRLNEHLFHAWPAAGYDFPALTTVAFEMPPMVIIGADLLPIPDVAFDRTYYGRWMLGYSDLLSHWWPRLIQHRLGDEPPPDPFFTNQIGSTLSALLYLRSTAEALAVGTEFLTALTEHWVTLHEQAEPRTDELAAQVESRRQQLMSRTYKSLDYHSPASDSLASVLGWPGANLLFDTVFGPDALGDEQGLDAKRRYLDVVLSPGTITADRPSH